MEWLEGTAEVINFMEILKSFSHLINLTVSSGNVLLFNVSFRIYQETLLLMMDALFPSTLKLYIYIKIWFNCHIIPKADKQSFGNISNILPLILSLYLSHKVRTHK